jgi:plasmid stabilization system protein ParE
LSYRVAFSPEAEEQLVALYSHIADIAARYTEAIVSYCESGTMRDDVRPGLRITNYQKRTVIAFAVDVEQVFIIAIFYGGQDYETILQDDSEDGSAH